MIDRFSELLKEFGKQINLAPHPDKSNACSIHVPPITIQLQLNPTQDKLLLFAKIIEIPPGKFRENTLKEALKSNGLPDPRAAVFGYIYPSNLLAIYQAYPLDQLNGEKLAPLFFAFYEVAHTWHQSISRGQPPTESKALPPPPFGIRP